MDLSYGSEYDAFREEVKSFILSHKHKQPKPGDGIKSQAMRDWQSLLIEHGYHSRLRLNMLYITGGGNRSAESANSNHSLGECSELW